MTKAVLGLSLLAAGGGCYFLFQYSQITAENELARKRLGTAAPRVGDEGLSEGTMALLKTVAPDESFNLIVYSGCSSCAVLAKHQSAFLSENDLKTIPCYRSFETRFSGPTESDKYGTINLSAVDYAKVSGNGTPTIYQIASNGRILAIVPKIEAGVQP